MTSQPFLPPAAVTAAGCGPAPPSLASRLPIGLDTSRLQSLVELAAELLDAPVARLLVLRGGRLVTVAWHGSGVVGTAGAALCGVTVERGATLAVPDVRADPVLGRPAGHRGLPLSEDDVAAHLGVPLLDGTDVPVGALCVHDVRPRAWGSVQTRLLEGLGRGAVAELELAAATDELGARSARLELTLDAAGIGVFELHAATGRLTWDRRLIELFGYTPDTFVPDLDSFQRRLHPDDLHRVTGALDEVLASQGQLSIDYRIVLPDGELRAVSARCRVVLDETGQPCLVGAAVDSTERQGDQQRVTRVLETMTDAFFSLDEGWRFTYVNEQAERVLLRPRAELLDRDIWEEFPQAAGDSVFWREYHRAMATGEPVSFRAYYPPPLAAWFDVRAWRTPEGLSVYFHDVTARRQAETEREAAVAAREQTALDWQRAAAEATAAQQRLALLAEVTKALVSTLDVDEAMRRLTALVVPRLADWAMVTLVDDDGQLRESVANHHDVGRAEDMAVFAELQARVVTARSNSRQVVASGQARLVPHLDIDAASGSWEGDELTVLLRRLGCATLMAVPLKGREATLGVVVLAGGPDRPAFDEADLATAVELGQRAGLAVQNAVLYTRQATVAEVLQRSMLTPLPEPDHLELSARYLPAGKLAKVGGDFYWAGLQPNGDTVLAIGDVMGHDLQATAAMGQVLNLLRGIAYDSQDTPAGVLRRVDAAMQGLRVNTLATAAVVRIERGPAGAEPGWRVLRWSNAGHPPPLVLRVDGTVEVLEREPDLLLGVLPDSLRGDGETVLRPGDTLLLHTDGLVERRDRGLAAGLDRLAAVLAGRQGMPLEALCDRTLAELLEGPPDDDVALIALRTYPQGRPRPAEAGPADPA